MRGNPRIEYAGRSVDELVADFMQEHQVTGMSLAIVQAPYVTRSTNYGLSDAVGRQLVANNTLFDVRQIAEGYTAVAIMQLVESGKLRLEDTVSSHLPELPVICEGLTVRQVLQHQSGLPDCSATTASGGDPLNWLADQKLVFEPGCKAASSATDHLLLQMLVQQVSGQSYEGFVRAGQFQVLGLRNTIFASELDTVRRETLAAGEVHQEFLHQPSLINPLEPARGDSCFEPKRDSFPERLAIYASASDISFWDIGLAGDILIKDPALRKILYAPAHLQDSTPVASSGAWYFPGRRGLMISTGSGQGFSSLLSRYTDPTDLLCVTLLANKEGLDFTQLARQIAGAYDSRLGPPVQTAAMRVQESPHSVAESITRLEKALSASGVKVFSRLDHSQAAKGASLELEPTEEILFGNPAAGTLLMQSNRAVVVDLPLRAVAWEQDSTIWLAASDPVEICRRHGITDRAELSLKMRQGVDKALAAAVAP